jgi:hypothetical protein
VTFSTAFSRKANSWLSFFSLSDFESRSSASEESEEDSVSTLRRCRRGFFPGRGLLENEWVIEHRRPGSHRLGLVSFRLVGLAFFFFVFFFGLQCGGCWSSSSRNFSSAF